MIDVLFKTKACKFREKFYPEKIKAGILFSENGYALDKIMFYEEDGIAKDIFNDERYSIESDSLLYISDVVSLGDLFIEYFGNGPLTLSQIYMGYKMFLNDFNYLNRHLFDFGMTTQEVGYKARIEVIRSKYMNCHKQDLFEKLMKIINYKDLNKKANELEIPTKGK